MDLDLSSLMPPLGVVYYVSPTGPSGADGKTPATATSLPSALAKADVGTIIALPGEYFRNSHTLPVVAKTIRIVGSGPNVYLTGFELPSALTWTLESGNIYKTTRANANGVTDKRSAFPNAYGDFHWYQQKADLASITGPGQWAAVGSTVYVWPVGNANLVTDASFMRVSLTTGSSVVNVNGPSLVYLEGVNIEGGGGPTVGPLGAFSSGGTGGVPRLLAVDCTIKYAVTNGLSVTGALWSIMIRCGIAYTGNDGFNYHSGTLGGTTYRPDVVEIDCWSYATGLYSTVETQNGTTAHDGISILRVNGRHWDSMGPIIADDSGAKAWNIGMEPGKSLASTRFWPYAATAGAEQWLEECKVTEPVVGRASLYADSTSKIHHRRIRTKSMLGASKLAIDSAVIDTY
ncbi:hypothetical protein GS545_06055 [Rhodococcus hoagii]|nr:hypothetical protein [Prescottella equi]